MTKYPKRELRNFTENLFLRACIYSVLFVLDCIYLLRIFQLPLVIAWCTPDGAARIWHELLQDLSLSIFPSYPPND